MDVFGWMFLLLFIGFVIYFFGGMFILKTRGASGLEMIPNYTFWISLPKKAKVKNLSENQNFPYLHIDSMEFDRTLPSNKNYSIFELTNIHLPKESFIK